MQSSESLEQFLDVCPKTFLNHLFNIVHCSAADLMEQFEEFVQISCGISVSDPSALLRDVDEIYASLAGQIEKNMDVFVHVALETCFSTTFETLQDVQRRRSTLMMESNDSDGQSKNIEELKKLLIDIRSYHRRSAYAKTQLEELQRLRTMHLPDLEAVEKLQFRCQDPLKAVQNLMVSAEALKQIVTEGKRKEYNSIKDKLFAEVSLFRKHGSKAK